MSQATVEYRVERGVAVVTLRNPPVNAINHAMRAELLEAVRRANGDGAVRALVVQGANRTFVAGADIKEFGAPPKAPFLTDVLSSLETGPVPAIAVLEGHALGGGLELALACRARIASAATKLALPEVTLGLIPGAGGTQRLPRLIGAAPALDLILSGRSLEAAAAQELGLVDELVEGEGAALEWVLAALASGRAWPKTRERADHLVGTDHAIFESTLLANAQAWAGQVAPLRAVQAVQNACTLPFDEGLKLEREAFLECQASPQREALSYVFFAEREASKLPVSAGPKVELKEIFVVDVGPSAAKLATWFDSVGVAVHLVSTVPPAGVVVAPVAQLAGAIGMTHAGDRLVELVAPSSDAWAAITALMALAKRSGKVPVVTHKTSEFVSHLMKGLTAAQLAEAGARLLHDGVVSRASDFDVLVINGCGFSRYLGGPMFAGST